MKSSLNIIGAGKLGSVLGFLLRDRVQAVCNQSLESAQKAVDFIGAGTAVNSLAALPLADITLLSVPDSKIESVAQAWVETASAQPGCILFHASGSLSTEVLRTAAERGVFIASVHPLKSFASPEQACQTFAGTFCAVEGEERALEVLIPMFEALGADLGQIDSKTKALYHAACVMACGGLTALYASAENLLKEAGIPEEKIRRFLSPYMKLTLDNNANLGPGKALTGPIARGDEGVVRKHQEALKQASVDVQALYNALTQMQRDLS